MSVIFSQKVVAATVNMPTMLKCDAIRAPERIPTPSDSMTFFVTSANVIATSGGTIVHQPNSMPIRPHFHRYWFISARTIECTMTATRGSAAAVRREWFGSRTDDQFR
ncbi:MAG: hypothetical protein BWY92_01869 [Firmicutes bacterium ADurb.BinA052]|nr:MAG: hypothetical protein BWY92_01869 [Firmicutes bacterium ADurb.BinA052]